MKETNSKIEPLIKLMTNLIINSRLLYLKVSPQNASMLATKATAIKRKCKENKEDVKILEGVH